MQNVLLDGTPERPLLKICDFGYSKNEYLDSRPKSLSGTPDYIAPEVPPDPLSRVSGDLLLIIELAAQLAQGPAGCKLRLWPCGCLWCHVTASIGAAYPGFWSHAPPKPVAGLHEW